MGDVNSEFPPANKHLTAIHRYRGIDEPMRRIIQLNITRKKFLQHIMNSPEVAAHQISTRGWQRVILASRKDVHVRHILEANQEQHEAIR